MNKLINKEEILTCNHWPLMGQWKAWSDDVFCGLCHETSGVKSNDKFLIPTCQIGCLTEGDDRMLSTQKGVRL